MSLLANINFKLIFKVITYVILKKTVIKVNSCNIKLSVLKSTIWGHLKCAFINCTAATSTGSTAFPSLQGSIHHPLSVLHISFCPQSLETPGLHPVSLFCRYLSSVVLILQGPSSSTWIWSSFPFLQNHSWNSDSVYVESVGHQSCEYYHLQKYEIF